MIQIPPAESAEVDIFSIDPLMRSDPLFAALPMPSADPLAAPAGGPLHRPIQSPSASSGGANQWLLIGLGSGGAVVVLVILIVAVASLGGNSTAAKVPAGNLPAPQVSSQASSPSVAAPSPPSTLPATTSSAPPAATASTAPPANKAPATGGDTSSPPSQPDATAKKTPLPSGRHVLGDLPGGVQAWHSAGQGSLVGIFNLKADQNPNAQLSWMTALLPHLGYQKHYDSLVRDKPITEKANLQVGVTTIPEFLNPIEGKSTWSGYPFDGLALTHFAGMAGVEDARNVCAGQLPRSDPRAGIFGYDAVARPADVTDGTSQTVMIVGSGPLASPWIMGGGATIRGVREPLFDPISGLGSRGLSSGGTVVVMADGSVRQIPGNIDPKVFRAMCTIHGAETVDLQAAPAFNLEEWK